MPITRAGAGLLALALLSLVVVRPGCASETDAAAIEATAPLADSSEESVQAAIGTALRKAARGAIAMGLPWLRIQGAYVRPGYVGVQVIAMKEPEEADVDRPGREAEPSIPEREPGADRPRLSL